MLASSPPPSIRHHSKSQGFTLIELLVVIGIILILAGITFGISRGVQNAQARAKAKAELAVISQSLELFKSKYGDYPWIGVSNVASDENANNSAHGVMKTLVGWQSVTGTQVDDTDSNGVVFNKAKSTLDVSKLSLSKKWPASIDIEASPSSETYFVDPWGKAYVYIYKDLGSPSGWKRFGYILFCRGPDGKASSTGIDETTGEITAPDFRDQSDNVDNIFVGE